MEGLSLNNGKIRLIASPNLSAEDIEAIREGYSDRGELVARSLNEGLTAPQTYSYADQDKLNLLANLIRDGVLDIKIAFLESEVQLGIYHEKLGLICDEENNVIAFSGSMNESDTAMNINYEAIDVFCSCIMNLKKNVLK